MLKKSAWLLFLTHAFIACVPSQGPPATIADVNQIQQRIDALHKRVSVLEQSVAQWSGTLEETEKVTRQSRADSSVLIEDLRAEIKTLKGELEVLRFDMGKDRDSQKKFQEDLDLRLNDLEGTSRSKGAAAPSERAPAVVSNSPGLNTGDDITRYNRVLRIFMDKKDYDTAISQFDSFLTDYPNSRYNANAQYWMAEAYYAKGNYPRAITEFQKVVDLYPKNDKVCDATLKQGFAFIEMKDLPKAKLFLNEVKSRCPGTSTASKAQKRLTEIATASKP